MIPNIQIEKAAQIIRDGGLVAFPTETVYGLGANALDAKAVARIFLEKERPSFDPLIVHISDLSYLDLLTLNNDNRVMLLAQKFWPGPLTIVLPKSEKVPDIVTSGLPTVGIRMPDNLMALDLIRASGTPIAAPSANKFGRISPTTAQHVSKQLKGVDMILDGGRCTVGIESTVIALNPDGFTILREGIITAEELRSVLPQSTEGTNAPVASPGLLKSHYSPEKPIFLAKSPSLPDIQSLVDELKPKGSIAFVSFSGVTPKDVGKTLYLSKKGEIKEAAVNLFSILHILEEDIQTDFIIAEPIPGQGIAKAIMDKLHKASYRYKKPESNEKD